MQCNFHTQFMFLTNYNAVPKEFVILYWIFCQLAYLIRDQTSQRSIEGDSRMPKKGTDKKCEIQNNLAPVLLYFVIDSNRFKQRQKRVIQTTTEASENSNPNSDWNDSKGQYRYKLTPKRGARIFVLLVRPKTCFSHTK